MAEDTDSASYWDKDTARIPGNISGSDSTVDWGSVLNTGLKTVGDVVKTTVKDNTERPPSPQPPKPGTTTPQINVTLPPVSQPPATQGGSGSNTPIIVGAILGGSALLGLAIWAAGRKR